MGQPALLAISTAPNTYIRFVASPDWALHTAGASDNTDSQRLAAFRRTYTIRLAAYGLQRSADILRLIAGDTFLISPAGRPRGYTIYADGDIDED